MRASLCRREVADDQVADHRAVVVAQTGIEQAAAEQRSERVLVGELAVATLVTELQGI